MANFKENIKTSYDFREHLEIFKQALEREFFYELKDEIQKKLLDWGKLFFEYNSHTNLLSKNDIDVLFEKHAFDSCAVLKWQGFENCKKVLDVGAGGGFPSLILALCFPDKTIVANDSRIKKINFIELAKKELNLNNLEVLYSRIEDAPAQNADLIVSRAVGKTVDVWELSKKHLAPEGHFLIYKSNCENEIKDLKKKYPEISPKIIPYNLPLKENFKRNLIVF